MIQTRRRFLVCAGLAVAAGSAIAARRAAVATSRHRLMPPHQRTYGLIEDIDDRQFGEFLAHHAAPEASSYRAPPG